MASISATAASFSYFSQVEGPPSLPHRSVGELTNLFSSELHSSLITNANGVCIPILVLTPASDSNGPEPANANDDQGHPEGITTFDSAIAPCSSRAAPTMVVLSLGQNTLSWGQGGELRPLPLSRLSELSQPLNDYPMAAGDSSIDPHLECALSSGGFSIAPRTPISRPEVFDDYQPSRHVNITQELIPDGTPAVVTALPGAAVYSPPFNQTLGVYVVSGPSFSSSFANCDVIHPSRTTYQSEENGQATSHQLGQVNQGTPTLSAFTESIRGVGMNQQPRRHQCTMCDADYAGISGLNRHFTEKHLPWMACDFCGFQYPLGRKYLLTRHLETDHANV